MNKRAREMSSKGAAGFAKKKLVGRVAAILLIFKANRSAKLRRRPIRCADALGDGDTPELVSTRCATVIAGGDPMPAPARTKEAPIEALPHEERIRRHPYELYVQCGNLSGSEIDDWLQAEEEIRRAEEEAIDEASEESFWASDPPAY